MTPLYLLCIVLSGLLIRLHRENRKLRAARRKTAALMRRLHRDRNAREESFQAASWLCREEMAKNEALMEELAIYRDEARRAEERAWN